MSRHSKQWIFIFLFALVLFGIARLYYRLTDDFRLANMTYLLPFEAPWQLPELNLEEYQNLTQILDQKFSYFGKGAQCYVFVSEDQQYVLKFFKFKHLRPNALINFLPSISFLKNFKEKNNERKKRKLISVFNGYDLAFRENRDVSKLIYLHLCPSKNLNLDASIVDKIGFERKIHLDDVVFLIQRKGETLRTRLNNLLNQERFEDAQAAISSIVTMYISEYKKGILDCDHGVMHNTGFVNDQPFHLDVGEFHKDEQIQLVDFYKKDLERVVWKMDLWVKNTYPQYYQKMSHFLEKEYERWTGEQLNIKDIDPKQFKKRK